MKKLATVVIVLLVVVAGAGWYFLSNLDRIVAETIEAEGTRAMGTNVRVQDVSIQLRNGTASIGGLTIANPEGYSNPYAFELNKISIEIEYDTLDVVRIHVREPRIVAEARGLNNNFSDILDQMPEPAQTSSVTAPGETDDAGSESEAADVGEAESPAVLTIHLIEIDEATVILESDILDETREFVMGKISMRDVSGTSDQVARHISRELLAAVSRQVIIEVAKAQAGEELNRAAEKAEELLRDLFD